MTIINLVGQQEKISVRSDMLLSAVYKCIENHFKVPQRNQVLKLGGVDVVEKAQERKKASGMNYAYLALVVVCNYRHFLALSFDY